MFGRVLKTTCLNLFLSCRFLQKNMADSKMKQATLAFCGVTKSVVTNRGRLYKVELPEVVEDKESKVVQVKCVVCSQGFTAMKYLKHWLFKHAESDFTLQEEALPLSLKPDQTKKAANDVSRAQPANVPAAVTPQPKAPNTVEKKGRIGAKIRKTYTIDFRLKAFKLVEEAKKRISKKKNPFQYVANKMKVNKSLI